ncbi:aspartate--tRNA ligase [Metamycoplasma equirhinis]|uniref:Aspartate--tRNA ligase n=1 Tax=Metamycoplasma equirhinis TaxID=92402 RepID=A0ABZ0P9L2_9BACT|nr:aspartate--tRNA ligase [Metamycoplasma equirhinis]TPD98732.1 aspartate--tRNA ligase [Metamycoplasma equirhinis]WPB53707.1 aspartate--tRNA ligase [Metamycoplasma equirhinis]
MKQIYGGNLTLNDLDKKVELFGWIANKRKFKQQLFVDLRDSSGIVQLVFQNISDPKLTKESCIKVNGIIKKRLEANLELKSGEIEILVDNYEVLNSSKQIPFEIAKNSTNANEDLRLEYRFLDLRQEKMLENLKLRHKLSLLIRNFFDSEGYIEVETPILGKSTPEGARDYLVPTRKKGKFFALPQSPQLFKQLLMSAGIEKYFQIARVFRDEDLRKDRQPEFTQLDIEMSFGGREEIFELCEKMWKEVLYKLGYKISTPFPRMDYFYSMQHYGNDKPDTRFEFLIEDYTNEFAKNYENKFVKVIIFDRNVAEYLQPINETFKKNNGEILIIENLQDSNSIFSNKLLNKAKQKKIETPFAIVSINKDEDDALKSLGAVRTLLNELYVLADPEKLNFLWIVNWPMFEFDKENQSYSPAHHAFTQFDESTLEYLKTGELDKVRALSYDLVLNGFELGSGSIRIHDLKTQKLMFEILKISEKMQQERFGFFLKAFDYGLPPHNGIAFGIERVLMILTKSSSIRDVIAFPKNAKGIDLLTSAPSDVTKEQLFEYSLEIKK